MTPSQPNPFDALQALRQTLPDEPEDVVAIPEVPEAPQKRAVLTMFYERKGRGGKDATIIVAPDDFDTDRLAQLASDLKKALATGGSVRGTEILLQGDRRERLRKILSQKGFTVKG